MTNNKPLAFCEWLINLWSFGIHLSLGVDEMKDMATFFLSFVQNDM
jgi:hypothetical protein